MAIAPAPDDAMDLARQLAEAIAVGDNATALELTRAINDRLKAVPETRPDTQPSAESPQRDHSAAEPSVVRVRRPAQPRGGSRQAIVAALAEIGVPCRARLIADYVEARFGDRVEPRAFSALRRDERKAWGRSSARPTYLVPALEGRYYQPIRGLLTLSDWPLERRLVGPWSERADHLAATIQLARQLAWLTERDPAVAGRLAAVVSGMARSILGAADGSTVDTARVQAAAAAELAAVAERDDVWRHDAASRARNQLREDEQLWGAHVGVVAEAER